MTYEGSGVDYNVMDAFKRHAQKLAIETHVNLLDDKISVVAKSIGESATVFDNGIDLTAFVEEGLGTKNKVAEAMEKSLRETEQALELFTYIDGGKKQNGIVSLSAELMILNSYSNIAQCTAAMIINDLITVGAKPIGLNMHLAVGESKWFDNVKRWEAILLGWKNACDLAGCAWGGGETPTLKGIVEPGTCLLSGSGWGIIPNRKMLHGDQIKAGDAIIFYPSSGVHANGLTLCRQIADKLPFGFWQRMANGRTFGEALLAPTTIYARALNNAIAAGADVHYAVNITGHGWRKLMRAKEPFAYVIDNPPPVPEIFRFIMKNGPVDEREAYGNLNMGAGFAVFVENTHIKTVIDAAKADGINAFFAGVVEPDDKKSVIIRRPDKAEIVFSEEEMKIR